MKSTPKRGSRFSPVPVCPYHKIEMREITELPRTLGADGIAVVLAQRCEIHQIQTASPVA